MGLDVPYLVVRQSTPSYWLLPIVRGQHQMLDLSLTYNRIETGNLPSRTQLFFVIGRTGSESVQSVGNSGSGGDAPPGIPGFDDQPIHHR